MRFVINALIAVVVLVVAAVLILPIVVPKDAVVAEVAALVKERTGRDLIVGGEVDVSVVPRFGLSVEQAALSNANWAGDEPMVAMERLDISLDPVALLSGTVAVERFVLQEPVVHLDVAEDGRVNWQLQGAEPETEPSPEAPAADGSRALVEDVRLGDVRIVDGLVTYRNHADGTHTEISDVDIELTLPALEDPMSAEGGLDWNDERLSLTMAVERPRAFFDGGATPMRFDVQSDPIDLKLEGALTPGGEATLEGTFAAEVPSVRALAAWTGNALAPGSGFGPFSASGTLAASAERVEMRGATVALDGMNAAGDLGLDLSGPRPRLSGNLAVDRLDANIYFEGAAEEAAAPEGPAGETSDVADAPEEPVSDTADDAETATPRETVPVQEAATSGWSTDPIDFSGLKAIDADLRLQSGGLAIGDLEIGEGVLDLTLNDGLLTADLARLALYEGTGSGKVTLNGRGAAPELALDLDIAEVAAFPFLRDAIDFERLEGTAAIRASLKSAGTNEKALVESLSGSGEMTFTDGAIRGINLAQLFRNALSNPLNGWDAAGTRSTDFALLGGTVVIADGIARNDDLQLQGPLIRATGDGTVDLGQQRIDYRVQPKIVATLEGQGGESDLAGLEVPVLITGPWDDPRFRPDLGAVLEDPEATFDAAKGTVERLKEQDPAALLEGFLGRDGGSDEPPAAGEEEEGTADSPRSQAEEAVRGLFDN